MFLNKRTYLDRAAGVRGNASSPHEEGRRAKQILEDARTSIARLLEVQSDDIIFTSGATESNALAILGLVRALRVRTRPDAVGRNNIHVMYLPSSHASVVENMKVLASEGVDIEALPVTDFRVDTVALAKMIRKETALISMDAVCGETGVVWNTREVAEVLRKVRTGRTEKESAEATAPIPYSLLHTPVLHVDASQAPLTEKLTRAHFDADMLTFDGSKVGAMRGIGLLVARRSIALEPLYKGGGQERGLRSGSESPELAREFATALHRAVRTRELFRASANKNRELLITSITKNIPNVLINEGHTRVPQILNISLPGRDTDYLVALLDEAGFAISTRSACETDSEDGSRAVFVLTNDPERARTTLRISWGPEVTRRELSRFSRALRDAVAFVDSHA